MHMMDQVQRYFEKEGMTVRLRPTVTGQGGDTYTPDALAEGANGTSFIHIHEGPVTASATVPLHLAALDTRSTPVLVGLQGFTDEARAWATRFGITLVDGDTLAAACAGSAPEVTHVSTIAALLAEPALPEPSLAESFVTHDDAWSLTYEFPTSADIAALLAPMEAAPPEPVAAEAYFMAPEPEARPEQPAVAAEPSLDTLDFSAIVAEVTHLLAEANGESLALVEAPVTALVEVVPEAPEEVPAVAEAELAPMAVPVIHFAFEDEPQEPHAPAAPEVEVLGTPVFNAPEAEAPVAAEPELEVVAEEEPTVALPEVVAAPEAPEEPLVTLLADELEAATDPALEAPVLVAAGTGETVTEAPVENAAPAPVVDIWSSFAKPQAEEAPKSAPAAPAAASGWLSTLATKQE